MLFQKTTEFLFEKYPEKKFTNFTDNDTKELYNFLFSFYDEKNEDMLFKKDEIREAIVDFFKEEGNVTVVFKGYEKIAIRIRPFDINANTTRVLAEAKSYLSDLKQSIVDNAPRTDLIEIDQHIFKHLNDLIEKENPNLHKKNLIKRVVEEVFALSEKDVVVFLKGKIFIRLFKELQAINTAARAGREGRFNGLPPHELKKIEESVFIGGFEKHHKSIMEAIYSSGLDFSTITNEVYEKNNIAILQKGVKKFFQNKLTCDDFIIDGFVNYILRNIFDDIHKKLAEQLLSLFSQQIGTADIFMKYYSGEVIVLNGTKYQLPKIEDAAGTWWQIPVVKVVVKQRLVDIAKKNERLAQISKAQKDKDETYEKLETAKSDLEQMKIELQAAGEELDDLYKVQKKQRADFAELKQQVLKKPKDEELKARQKELAELMKHNDVKETDLLKTRERLEKNISIKTHQAYELDVKYNTLVQKEEEDKEKVLTNDRTEAETKEKYELILSATASALTKKKTAI